MAFRFLVMIALLAGGTRKPRTRRKRWTKRPASSFVASIASQPRDDPLQLVGDTP
jgi:hypothetical protein